MSDQQSNTTDHQLHSHQVRLQEHSAKLDDHSRQLASLQAELCRQGDMLRGVSDAVRQIETQVNVNVTSLAQMTIQVQTIKELLDAINGHQMRLVYILVATLIALAGVSRLDALGIF